MPRSNDVQQVAAGVAPQRAEQEAGIAAVLGRIPSGLFVITWRDDARDRGMLASWVMQAGFDPPLITIAVATSRDLLSTIAEGKSFVVNVLGESQRSLLARFGRPPAVGEDPFAGLTITRTDCGAAAITAATGWLECRRCQAASGLPGDSVVAAAGGDHTVVLGEVLAGHRGSEEPPLVHLRRNGLRY